MNLHAAREGVLIALDALRSNKVRASLTILGIVIGVATVMAMATMIGGLRSAVTGQLESLGPKNFIVERFDMTQLRLIGDGNDNPWEGKPPITLDEADLLRRMPSIRSVAPSVTTGADVKAERETVTGVMVLGRGYQWPDYAQGDFLNGANFLPGDERRSTPVAVLSDKLTEALFDTRDPTGERIRVAGQLFTVSGVYRQKENLFSGTMPNWIIVPPTSAIKHLDADEDGMSLLVVPTASATQTQAMDEVTAALRIGRGLRPGDENNFALIRQEAFLAMFDRITGAFFRVMLVLSSIGLMVGGVGVVAIMMISVTERTREIGVRKALGATRREILWQFLIESMTVTLIGAVLGMLLGGGGALLLSAFTPVPAVVPLWSVAAALVVAAVSGIGFGLYPASRASRLDPVEALRYE